MRGFSVRMQLHDTRSSRWQELQKAQDGAGKREKGKLPECRSVRPAVRMVPHRPPGRAEGAEDAPWAVTKKAQVRVSRTQEKLGDSGPPWASWPEALVPRTGLP